MFETLAERLITELSPIVTRSATWRSLAFADIRSKYRRTFIGPWWITVSNGFTALIIGLVSGRFLGSDMSTYLPFFVAGMTIWGFVSSSLLEGSSTLIYAGGLIKASNLPISFYVLRMVQRNFIIFLHNILVVPMVWLFLPWHAGWHAVLAIPGLALVYIFTVGAATIVGMVCARYRDIPPIVATGVQLFFFISPIIWMPEQLHSGQLVMDLNPVSYLLAVVRDPVLGRPVPLESWLYAVATALTSALLAIFIYVRYRRRLVFWV